MKVAFCIGKGFISRCFFYTKYCHDILEEYRFNNKDNEKGQVDG